ncbi:MAG TPA: hypothetical protein VLB44_01085 [Kofleriaceae bacterium]|nr:hypothetical protein [Kofleriaceae bacterium]
MRARLDATLAAGTVAATTAVSVKLIISIVLSVIGITGVVAYLALHDASPAAARVEPPPPAAPTDIEPTSEHVALEESAPPAAESPSLAQPRPRDERAILDEAMRCLARRAAACALAEVAVHVRQYPNGVLVEEREAIRVEALDLAGDVAAAHRRARTFLERYPTSVHATRVRQIADRD